MCCANNLKESIKSKLILNRPKKIIAIKRELENSKVQETQSAKQKNQTLNKIVSETDSFVSRSIHISKIVQGTHHQWDNRYGISSGI